MTDVFISYKREERGRCVAIYNALVNLKLSVWFDAHIEPGTDFDREIEREVRSAKAVLVLWSALAADSDWIRAEARTGRQNERLVAARLDDCLPPLEFASVQAVDLFDRRDVSSGGDWQSSEGWRQVVGRIGRLVGRPGLGDYVRCEQAADAGLWRGWIAANPDDPLVETARQRVAALAHREPPDPARAAPADPVPAEAPRGGPARYWPLFGGSALLLVAVAALTFGRDDPEPPQQAPVAATASSDLPVLPEPAEVVPMAAAGGGKPLFCRPDDPFVLSFVARRTDMPPVGNLTIANTWLAWRECRGPVRVEGHVESGGGSPADSQRMADVVANELRARGVDPKAIRARGFGASRPLAGTPAEAIANRRVEIYLDPSR
ncbi:TIR domain-containing protein [Sphingopyxis sp. J-6]|uniref:TIR domain-containing protein n=1 Tax=Sphingopyxis sp. J-6 TaxID=3122054 RepID=UPI0039841F03